MKPRIIFIHGNQTTHWSFGWAPWLKGELEALGFETFFETMPDSIMARAEYWLPFLEEHVKAGKNDVLVGWSSGAVAAMRYAESHKLKGSVLISPCYTDLGNVLEKQSGYYDQPWQWQKLKANQGRIVVISGDDDPYVPQEQFRHIAAQLHAAMVSVPGGEHFIDHKTLPEALRSIVQYR